MMTENGPTTPHCSFMYDAAVYYDEFDPKKTEIQKLRDKLEHSRWGFSICDPHRDGQGEQMKRFKQSFLDSRHAIVFLSPDVLERMNTNREDGVEYKMLTFLAGILESHDIKLKRRLIPVVFGIGDEYFQKPFLLSDFSILCPEKKGFNRHLYRNLSKLPAQTTITQRQIRQRVDAMGRSRYTETDVIEVATGLEIPEEVLEDIKQEYGGHKAMLIETMECWRLHHGPEATAAMLERVLEGSSSTPYQVADLPPQSMVRINITEEPRSRAPIQRQTTTSEVQGSMDETAERFQTYKENLVTNTEEAQLHGSANFSPEADAVTSETEAPSTEESQAEETEADRPPPESEAVTSETEAPITNGERQADETEGPDPVTSETEAPITEEERQADGTEGDPESDPVISATEAPNTEGERQAGETEGARDTTGPEAVNRETEAPIEEENQADEIEGAHGQLSPESVGNNAATPPDTREEKSSAGPGAEGSQLLGAAALQELDTPPDSREVDSATGVEGNTAEKPPVPSNNEEEVVSDGLQEQASPVDGVQAPVTTDTDVQAVSEEVERLNLESPSTVEASQSDTAKKKSLLSRFSFRSFRETASGIKKRLTPQKRSDKSSVQRSTSTPSAGGTSSESLMMTRSTSFDSGKATTAAASGRTKPAVPAKSTTDKAAKEKLQEEEKLVSSLPSPPSDKVEEKKSEKTQKKKGKTSQAPLAAT
ncbi:PREDICTED: flocculation protein FLO11-like [Branchiostoma belcheri]|uniref:Flocculation protein FLO11-like n=1 Tax=Branchiostoma belcheri TaxID=7741 RepID=A0A6P4YGF4_BRABE|nr:PREDICTED: flocculation protein FLO11-like [Branchiostoma belcheri]